MKFFDFLKWGAFAMAAFVFVLIVAGLCYLVLGSFRESLKVRSEMQAGNAELQANGEHLRQLNDRLALENQDNRNQITVLEQNLTALQERQDLIVDLAVQLRREQLTMQANQPVMQAFQNITVIVQQGRKASGTPMYNIDDKDMETRNLTTSDDFWQENCFTAQAGNVVCFRAVNDTTPVNNTAAVNDTCQLVADGRLMCWYFEET